MFASKSTMPIMGRSGLVLEVARSSVSKPSILQSLIAPVQQVGTVHLAPPEGSGDRAREDSFSCPFSNAQRKRCDMTDDMNNVPAVAQQHHVDTPVAGAGVVDRQGPDARS
jgi:hypothetical protein